MKQRLAPLLLVLALCAGLTAPALAGDEPVPRPYFTISTQTEGRFVVRMDRSADGEGWSFDAATRTIALSGAGIQYLEICRAAAPVNLVLADGTTGALIGGSAVLAALRAGLTIWWSARSTGGGPPV